MQGGSDLSVCLGEGGLRARVSPFLVRSSQGLLLRVALQWVGQESRAETMAGKQPEQRNNFLWKH